MLYQGRSGTTPVRSPELNPTDINRTLTAPQVTLQNPNRTLEVIITTPGAINQDWGVYQARMDVTGHVSTDIQ